jgi:hypothetical protein
MSKPNARAGMAMDNILCRLSDRPTNMNPVMLLLLRL